MPKDVLYGKTLRKSFARYEEIQDMPNLLEIQKKSYKWFLETGLREVFRDTDAVTDYSGKLELSFVDYSMASHHFVHVFYILYQDLTGRIL